MKFVWKNFPENPLSHDPISIIVFSLIGSHEIQLEKFSRNAPHSWPEIKNFEKNLEKFSLETLWVTTRFLEIFSRIWQYGLSYFLSFLDALPILPNPGKYFQKPGGHSEGFLENFSRLFFKFLISDHEWGAFPENFSSWILWLPNYYKIPF